jgi:hypothetical protein
VLIVFLRKPRFSLRTIFLVISGICLLLSWGVWEKQRAEKLQALRKRQEYVETALGTAHHLEPVRNQSLLRKYRLGLNWHGSDRSGLRPGTFTINNKFSYWSHTYTLPEWPVEELKQAILSSHVQAVQSMNVLSSVDTVVSSDCAMLAGEEGWIIWEFQGVEKKSRASKTPELKTLRLIFTCRGRFHFEEPFAVEPNFYKLGFDSYLALQSKDAEDRLAGTSFISPIKEGRADTDVVLAAIDRETDPRVMSGLFKSLEADGLQPPSDLSFHVFSRLRSFLKKDHPNAPLAARTILRSSYLFTLFQAEHDQWNTTALGHIRRASIDELKKGDDEHWKNAALVLREQMTDDDVEAIDAMLCAIQRGGRNAQDDCGLFNLTLRGNPHAVDRLFVVLGESDRPDVWHPAAEILRSSVRMQGVGERIRSLTGESQRRIQLAGSYSVNYRDELQALGDDAFEFLVPLVKYDIREKAPSLHDRACDMLAKLGGQRAVPVLVRAVEDHYRHGKLNSSDVGYDAWGAVRIVKAINELTGENVGELGTGRDLSSEEIEKCDWPAIRETLAKKLGEQ